MTALGQKQTFAVQKGMSALPPKAECPLRAKSEHHCWSFVLARLDPGEFEWAPPDLEFFPGVWAPGSQAPGPLEPQHKAHAFSAYAAASDQNWPRVQRR
jgi:hypothetical protein